MFKQINSTKRILGTLSLIIIFLVLINGSTILFLSFNGRSMLVNDVFNMQQAQIVETLVLHLRRYEKDLFLNIHDKNKCKEYKNKWNFVYVDLLSHLNAMKAKAQQLHDDNYLNVINKEFKLLSEYKKGYSLVYSKIDANSIVTPEAANNAIVPYKPYAKTLFNEASALSLKSNNQMYQQKCKILFYTKVAIISNVLLCLLIFALIFYSNLVTKISIDSLFELTKKLKKSKDKAVQATKAKSNFLACMSHEIRTPMNGLLGYIQLLKSTDLTAEQKEYLDDATNSFELLYNLINDILDFSKLEAGRVNLEKTNFNLKETIEDVINLSAYQAKSKNLEINLLINDDVPQIVLGDSLRLKQILINLLSNAIKFTNQGEITLKVALLKEMEGNLFDLCFDVIDTGIGIEKSKQKKIFDLFTQADDTTTRNYGGSGLGLSITKKLVNMMGGEIAVESVENKGSKFSFNVIFEKVTEVDSVVINDKFKSDKNAMINSLQNFDSKIILVVDDSEMNRNLVVRILNKNGFNCDTAQNGIEAVEAFKSKHYDLILMDCQMPDMDGYEATKKIRELENGDIVPIVAITANTMNNEENLCYNSGMNEFLSKPIKIDILLETIYKHLSQVFNSQAH